MLTATPPATIAADEPGEHGPIRPPRPTPGIICPSSPGGTRGECGPNPHAGAAPEGSRYFGASGRFQPLNAVTIALSIVVYSSTDILAMRWLRHHQGG